MRLYLEIFLDLDDKPLYSGYVKKVSQGSTFFGLIRRKVEWVDERGIVCLAFIPPSATVVVSKVPEGVDIRA